MKKRLILFTMVVIACLTCCSNSEIKNEKSNNTNADNKSITSSEQSESAKEAEVTETVPTEEITPTEEATPTESVKPTEEAAPTEEPASTEAGVSLMIPIKYSIPNLKGGGTIESITYMAKDHLGEGPDVEKKAFVYLPEGYDSSKKYNVLYLMHGIGGDENEWGLNTGKKAMVKIIMDNLISNGIIEPFIVVTPNGKAFALSNTSGNDLFYKFGYELRNDLIPYIESHYSTYAEYDENGYDLSATRTHRAMAGLSMGGMQTINIGMCECLDLFSWFGAFSAAPTSYASSKVAGIVDASEYKVDFFYNICGTGDGIAYSSASAAAKNLPSVSKTFVENENFMWQERSGGHDFNIWNLGFYNFAQIAFKGYDAASAE